MGQLTDLPFAPLYYDSKSGMLMATEPKTATTRPVNMEQDGVELQNTNVLSANTSAPAVAPAAPNQAQVDAMLESLGALDTVRAEARKASKSQYDKNVAGYAEAEKSDKSEYNKQVAQNEGNMAADRQAALLAAAQGGRGLRSVLAALGALQGTGSLLADRAIANAANQDIGAAQDSFETNADTLTTAYRETEREQRQRRADAEAALQNEYRAADLARYQGQQNVYNDIANIYGLETPKGAEYLSKASALYGPIAGAGRQNVASYAAPNKLYSPQALDNYKAGVSDLTVETAPAAGNSDNRPVLQAYQGKGRKRDEEVV